MPGNVGKYDLKKQLGTGAASTVYLATDTFSTNDVALKVIETGVLRDAQAGKSARTQFLHDASLVGKLAHPHIVTILDAVVSDESVHIAMEYVAGGNLAPYTSPHNLLPLEHVIEIGFKCCGALDYACRAGIIHRDIKPANILVVRGTEIKVTDFGAAIPRPPDMTQSTDLESLSYMSPEQINGEEPGPASDMFSLAIVLYQLLTGHKPFAGKTGRELADNIRLQAPAPLQSLRKDLPPELDRVLARALAKKPDERYATWAEFSRELAKLAHLGASQYSIPDSEKFSHLRALPMLKPFNDPEIWRLVQAARWQRLPAHREIIREDEDGASLFLLTHGEVKVTKRAKFLNVLRAGECFGEMGYIKGRGTLRQATVESMTEVVVAEFAREAIEANVDATCGSSIVLALLNTLVDRLAMADAQISRIIN